MFSKVVAAASGQRTAGAGFFATLRESVLTALVDVLGAAGARATLYYIDLSESTDVKQIHTWLVVVFGAGAASLEAAILRELYSRLGLRFEPHDSRTFADYVSEVKRLSAKTQAKANP